MLCSQCKLRRHEMVCTLKEEASNAKLTTPKPQKRRIPTESTQRGHDITIRDFNYKKTLRSEVTAHSSTSSCAYPHINMRTYVSGCVRADAYNLILIFASYYYAPWPWPWPWPCTVYI